MRPNYIFMSAALPKPPCARPDGELAGLLLLFISVFSVFSVFHSEKRNTEGAKAHRGHREIEVASQRLENPFHDSNVPLRRAFNDA